MAKDVNIHVKAKGIPQAKQQLDGVAKSSQRVGDTVSRSAKKGADGMDKLSGSTAKTKGRFAKFTSSIKSWAAGLVGITAIITAITRAVRVQSEALKEHAQIASRQQKSLLALQAMGTFIEEHPEARKEVAAYAELGRRPFEEVAGAWYGLESKGAGLTAKQKRGIMTEALELGRQEPDADLKSIVDMFSLYAKQTKQKDINLIQNVFRATMTKAGAELSEVGQYLPQFQPLGISGGLTGPEAAGIWAYATTVTARPEQATTGLRNIFSALQGKGTPESKTMLQGLGITPEMNFFRQLQRLSSAQKTGKFGVPEAESLAGRENIAVLLSMLQNPRAMMETIGYVTGRARGDIDITKTKLQQIMGTDEVARLEENIRRLDIQIQNQKGSGVRSLRWQELSKQYEVEMREAGLPEWYIRLQNATMWGLGAVAPGIMEPARPAGSIIINNHYDHSQHFNPRWGSDERGPVWNLQD